MAITATPTNAQVTHREGIRAAAQIYGATLAISGAAELGSLNVDGNAVVEGTLTVGGVAVPLANVVPIPLNQFRAPAAWKDDLGDTGSSAIIGLADTPGSLLKTTASNGDVQNQSAVHAFVLPPTYVSGAAITVRVRAKKDTTAAQVSDTVDVTVKLVGDTLGSDLCTTAAQAITTSYANKDFTVTPTGLVAGDILAIEVFGISDDTGGTTNKQVFISRVEVRTAAA